MLPWSSTGSSCGFLSQCVCWELWDSSSSRSSASSIETLVFSLSLSLSLCLLLSNTLELVRELSVPQLFHIKQYGLSSFPISGVLSPPPTASLPPSFLVLRCLFPHMTYPHFLVPPLSCPINVHVMLLSSLITVFFTEIIITSALLLCFFFSYEPLLAAFLFTVIFCFLLCSNLSDFTLFNDFFHICY